MNTEHINWYKGFKNYLWWLVLVMLCLPSVSFCATPKKLAHDKSKVIVKTAPAERLSVMRQDPAYQYYENATQPPSFWQSFWRQVIAWIDDFFGNPQYGVPRKLIGWLFVIGVVIFTVLKLMGVNASGLLHRKSEAYMPYDLLGDNIHQIDFERAIDEAVQKRQYRLAVRLCYLRVLKQLSSQQLIAWQPNKTNRQYSYELSVDLRPAFEQLTEQFEYVWYGDFALNQTHFEQIIGQFSAFSKQVEHTRP